MRLTLGFLYILSGMLLCYFDKAKNKQTNNTVHIFFFFIFKYAVLRNQILLLLLLFSKVCCKYSILRINYLTGFAGGRGVK